MAKRHRYILVCTNRRADDNPKGSCAAKGSEAVHQALKVKLFERGLAKLEARVCTASCLDQCATGISVLVEPDHFFYGRVTLEDVPAIVAALEDGTRVERLVVSEEDLERG
jgi:(2Fe-2S) ferredoxin